MKNPRFEDEAIAPLRFPEAKKILCKDCMLREPDRNSHGIFVEGATLGTCQVGWIKPNCILYDGEDCPYYIPED